MRQINVYELGDYQEISKLLRSKGYINTGVTQDKLFQWNDRISYFAREGELIEDDIMSEEQFFDLIHDYHDITAEVAEQTLEEFKENK
jgi:hypothetical protein